MLQRLGSIAVLASVACLAVAATASSGARATRAQAIAAGWNCNPEILIGGYYHCASPGEPSLLDVVFEVVKPPTLHLNVYFPGTVGQPSTQLLAGTEELIRADLFAGQPCPQEGGSWTLLFFGYYGCHHFAA
jgi:hypothetical protein